jgi:membrane protein required for beta-lactamase induction
MTVNSQNSQSNESGPIIVRENSCNRWIALSLISMPFILALPVNYLALNHFGSWFVSTSLEPEHRRVWLGIMYLGLMLAISIWCFFAASILLWRDRLFPVISGFASLVFGILAIPAGVFIAIFVGSYFKYK